MTALAGFPEIQSETLRQFGNKVFTERARSRPLLSMLIKNAEHVPSSQFAGFTNHQGKVQSLPFDWFKSHGTITRHEVVCCASAGEIYQLIQDRLHKAVDHVLHILEKHLVRTIYDEVQYMSRERIDDLHHSLRLLGMDYRDRDWAFLLSPHAIRDDFGTVTHMTDPDRPLNSLATITYCGTPLFTPQDADPTVMVLAPKDNP